MKEIPLGCVRLGISYAYDGGMTNTQTTYTATAPDGTTFNRKSKSTTYGYAVLAFVTKEQVTEMRQTSVEYWANEMVRPDQGGGCYKVINDSTRLLATQEHANAVARLNNAKAFWKLIGFRTSYDQAVKEMNKVLGYNYGDAIIVQAVK